MEGLGTGPLALCAFGQEDKKLNFKKNVQWRISLIRKKPLKPGFGGRAGRVLPSAGHAPAKALCPAPLPSGMGAASPRGAPPRGEARVRGHLGRGHLWPMTMSFCSSRAAYAVLCPFKPKPPGWRDFS